MLERGARPVRTTSQVAGHLVEGGVSLNDAADTVFTDAKSYSGHLIALCGFDGSGKTTQISSLGAVFEARGYEVVETRQPTTAYRAEPVVRHFLDHGGDAEHAHTLAVMAAADRLKHVHEVVRPALERGAIVLCDRYVFSSLVFFENRGVDPEFVAKMNAGIPRPTLSTFLDAPVPTLMRRLVERDGPVRKHEERNQDVITGIVDGFRALTRHLSTVDAARPAPDITQAILNKFDVRTTARAASE